MNEDLNLLPWEGVSLEEVLNLFTECVQNFPPTEIADGTPYRTASSCTSSCAGASFNPTFS
jgi:hypothetical protein